jgi:hypothetical protein
MKIRQGCHRRGEILSGIRRYYIADRGMRGERGEQEERELRLAREL